MTWNVARPSKRRRIENLNARYDRMIETANIVHRSSSFTDSKRSRRQRAISSASGSSSTASHDIPRTPVDAYNDRILGILDISQRPLSSNIDRPLSPSPTHYHGTSMILPVPSTEPKEPVPQWILETVSSLDQYHPLRTIMPIPTAFREQLELKVKQHIPRQSFAVPDPVVHDGNISASRPPTAHGSNHLLLLAEPFPPDSRYTPHQSSVVADSVTHDEEIFAFRPPTAQDSNLLSLAQTFPSNSRNATYQNADALHTNPPYNLPTAPDIDIATDSVQELLHQANALQQVPFTTPGPSTASFNPTYMSSSQPRVLFSQGSPVNLRSPYNDRQYPSIVEPRDIPTHALVAAQNSRIQPPNIYSPIPDSNCLMYDIANETSDSDQCSLSDVFRSPSLSPGLNSTSQSQSPIEVLPSMPNLTFTQAYQETLSDIQLQDNPLSPGSPLARSFRLRPPVAAGFRVYFDDPVEDPSDPSSDPLEEPDYQLDLDYGPNDFKWSRFEPTGLPETPEVQRKTNNFWTKQTINVDDCAIDVVPLPHTPIRRSEFILEESQPQYVDSSLIDESSSTSDAEQSQPSDKSWSLLPHARKATGSARSGAHGNTLSTTADPPSAYSQTTTAFAPEAGIYVSPLRITIKDENSPANAAMDPDPDHVPLLPCSFLRLTDMINFETVLRVLPSLRTPPLLSLNPSHQVLMQTFLRHHRLQQGARNRPLMMMTLSNPAPFHRKVNSQTIL